MLVGNKKQFSFARAAFSPLSPQESKFLAILARHIGSPILRFPSVVPPILLLICGVHLVPPSAQAHSSASVVARTGYDGDNERTSRSDGVGDWFHGLAARAESAFGTNGFGWGISEGAVGQVSLFEDKMIMSWAQISSAASALDLFAPPNQRWMLNSTADGESTFAYEIASRDLQLGESVRLVAGFRFQASVAMTGDGGGGASAQGWYSISGSDTYWIYCWAYSSNGPRSYGTNQPITIEADSRIGSIVALHARAFASVSGAAHLGGGVRGADAGQAYVTMNFTGCRVFRKGKDSTPLKHVQLKRAWPPTIDFEHLLTQRFNAQAGHSYHCQYSDETKAWIDYGPTIQPTASGVQELVVSATDEPTANWRVIDLSSPTVAIPTTTASAYEANLSTRDGRVYQWQVSTNLTQWQDLGSAFTGSGRIARLAIPTSSMGRCFYRIKSQ